MNQAFLHRLMRIMMDPTRALLCDAIRFSRLAYPVQGIYPSHAMVVQKRVSYTTEKKDNNTTTTMTTTVIITIVDDNNDDDDDDDVFQCKTTHQHRPPPLANASAPRLGRGRGRGRVE